MFDAWIASHTALMGYIIPALAIIVIVDHYLAATHAFKANSTAQAVVKWVGVIFEYVLKIVSPSSYAALPVQPVTQPAAVTATAAPAAQTLPGPSAGNQS